MTTFFQTLLTGILYGGLLALIGMGLSMIFGVMNVVNFAHGALVTFGMYVSWHFFHFLGLDPYLSLLLVMPVTFFFGMFLQWLLVERVLEAGHLNQILVTEGVGLVLVNLALLAPWLGPNYKAINPQGQLYAATIRFLGLSVGAKEVVAFGIVLALTALLFWFLYRTDLGKSMRATAQDREAARLMGINVRLIGMYAMGIGVTLAGAAGCLLGPIFSRVDPYIGNPFTLISFVVVVLGGMGSIEGAAVGGLVLGVVHSLAGTYNPAELGGAVMAPVYMFIIFILILIFRPAGLMGRTRE